MLKVSCCSTGSLSVAVDAGSAMVECVCECECEMVDEWKSGRCSGVDGGLHHARGEGIMESLSVGAGIGRCREVLVI